MLGPTATRAISISCISGKIVLARPAMMSGLKRNRSAKLRRRLRLHRHCRCSNRRRARNQQRRLDSTQFRFRFRTATPPASIPMIISVRSVRAMSVRHNENSPCPERPPPHQVIFEFSPRPDLESRHASHTVENVPTSDSRNQLSGTPFVFAAQAFSCGAEIFPVRL